MFFDPVFAVVAMVALWRATSFPNVIFERVDTSFLNVLIHELEVHCNNL